MRHTAGQRLEADIAGIVSRLPNSRTHISDALFGYEHIHPYLERLRRGSVLEVGSGPCILLSHIKANYPDLRVVGIEPIIDGFETSRQIAYSLKESYQLELFEGGYEDFPARERFDLIFLVNVFEHLPDWRDFLSFVERQLTPGGVCVVLCPNYGFPYESHFRLPIIVNKRVTYSIFRRTIVRYEIQHNARGLWDSLNFVSLRQICSELRSRNLQMAWRPSILDEQVKRLQRDREFNQRQRIIGRLAGALSHVGITKLFRFRPLHLFQPYLLLEFSLKSDARALT